MATLKRPRLSRKELAEAFTLLSALVEAGLPLREALGSAAELSARGNARAFLFRSRDALVRGKSLSVAMRESTDSIPGVVLGMLSVADRTGEGARLLAHARDYLESGEKLAGKLSGALAYPVMVLFVLVLAVIGLRFAVLPAFRQFADQMGGTAGAEVTRLAARLAGLIVGLALGLGVIAVSVAAALTARRNSAKAAERIDRALLSLPGIGPWLTLRATHEFAFAMEVLLAGGLPLSAALAEAAEVATNREFRRRVEETRSRIATGRPLSEAIKATALFRKEFAQWVALGERTGRQREVFARIRAYSGDEIERRVAGFSQIIEPAITVALGLVMIAFIAGFIVPLFGVYGNLL